MLEHDVPVKGPMGLVVASFGPRALQRGAVVCVSPAEAAFWSVYRHNCRGEAACVADVDDRPTAEWTAKRLASHAEPVTIAYLAIGAQDYFSAKYPAFNYGQLDLIERVTTFGPELDVMVDGIDLEGVFAYEVARPFGCWLAQAFAGHGEVAGSAARARAEAMVSVISPIRAAA